MILEYYQGGKNVDYDCCKFKLIDPEIVWVVFWEFMDMTVYLSIPGFQADLPPLLELTRTTVHAPASWYILSNACIWFLLDEMTQMPDPLSNSG